MAYPELTLGGPALQGTIPTAGAFSVYQFTIGRQNTYIIEADVLQGTGGLQLSLFLFKYPGTSSFDHAGQLKIMIPAGTHYVVVKSFDPTVFGQVFRIFLKSGGGSMGMKMMKGMTMRKIVADTQQAAGMIPRKLMMSMMSMMMTGGGTVGSGSGTGTPLPKMMMMKKMMMSVVKAGTGTGTTGTAMKMMMKMMAATGTGTGATTMKKMMMVKKMMMMRVMTGTGTSTGAGTKKMMMKMMSMVGIKGGLVAQTPTGATLDVAPGDEAPAPLAATKMMMRMMMMASGPQVLTPDGPADSITLNAAKPKASFVVPILTSAVYQFLTDPAPSSTQTFFMTLRDPSGVVTAVRQDGTLEGQLAPGRWALDVNIPGDELLTPITLNVTCKTTTSPGGINPLDHPPNGDGQIQVNGGGVPTTLHSGLGGTLLRSQLYIDIAVPGSYQFNAVQTNAPVPAAPNPFTLTLLGADRIQLATAAFNQPISYTITTPNRYWLDINGQPGAGYGTFIATAQQV